MFSRRADAAIQERLVSGEHVVVSARIHDGIYWKAAAVFIFAVLVAVFLPIQLGILLGVVSLIMVVHATVLKEILLLVVTNKRVMFRYGILMVDVVDLHFDKVESIELERMLPGYIMGYSNVVMMGTGNRLVVIPYVANGPEIRRAYNEQTLGEKK